MRYTATGGAFVLSVKTRDLQVVAGLAATVVLISFAARLLLPQGWWMIALVASLCAIMLVQLDTYRRLQSMLREIHDDPGQNYRQVEALFSLFALLPVKAALPPMRGAAISPDLAAQLASIILRERPRTVLELGSGASTIVGGYALRASGQGRLVSCDESSEYAGYARARIALHGLEDIVTIRHAPLQPTRLPGGEYHWYDQGACDLEQGIDLLIVDGPLQMGRSGEPVRYPALPLLANRLSRRCVVLIDDCHRPQEKQMVERWLREFPDFTAERTSGEKQHVILRRVR